MASLSEAGTIQTRDGLTPYSDPQSSNSYTVQAGDTLQSIAQTVYGNANLWYVIADANAISLDRSGNAINLIAGTTLKLPAVSNQQNSSQQNSSQTFTPYNPLKLIGSTTPALATIPPPPQHHCNDLTTLIVVAVTIAVTVYTAGAAAEELGAVAASGLGLPSSNDQRMGLGQGFQADLAGGVLDGGGGHAKPRWPWATTMYRAGRRLARTPSIVLPGAVPFGGLMADAEPGQCEAKQPALEDRLVVGADCPGFAVVLDGVQ